ncbi:glucose-methanol-choline oxidoreductase-like protein [Usnea florida]
MAQTTEIYDFIVIGGGTSGLVLAARLTEDPQTTVLVLEAGQDHLRDPTISIPALWPALLGSDADWKFSTTPQEHLDGRTIGHPQGRALGGSSALNTQAFIAPSEVGIDLWSNMGNPTWDWKTMAPYYRKCHTLVLPPEDVRAHLGLEHLIEGKYGGTDGPIQVSYSGTLEDTVGKAWIDTFRALNYALTGDPFSGAHTGGYANPTTVNPVTKERSYSASAYYAPAQARSNLRVLTGTQVEKITFDTRADPVVATGVLVTTNGVTQAFRCQKECILAAGTFNSSKLLELSGIGDPKILQSHGIEVVVDNSNVGENFQDHPLDGMSFEVKDDVTTMDVLNRKEPHALEAAMSAYQSTKTGPFSGAAINSFAFLPVVDFQSSDGQMALKELLKSHPVSKSSPEISRQLEFVRSVISSTDKSSASFFLYACQGNFGADGSNPKDVTKILEPGNYVTIATSLSYPLSRGNVHIRSGSAGDKPIIDPRYLSHPLDMEIYARHVRFIDSIVSTEPLASILKAGGRRSPAFAEVGPDLEAAKNYIRRTMISAWHPVGTCAMRPRNDGGVVDERLLVYGSKNLRVVDASIMPFICRGNTQSTVYAVAERAADLIKEDHKMT